MASPGAQNASGTTITFATGFFAQINSIDWTGINRKAVETSHMNLSAAAEGKFGNATFVAGKVIDAGSLKIEMNFNPDTIPPVGSAAESTTVTWASGATWVGSAFLTDFEVKGATDECITATATLKYSGNVTVTAGS
jgi:hypothetical protein